MNIIVVGAGKVGQVICSELAEQHNIAVIDTKEELVQHMMNKFDVTGIVGNGVTLQTQKQAGIDVADIFIAVTESDEINIIASTLAKKAGATYTIARVRNPQYVNDINFLKEALGISIIITPELAAARDIARSIRYASALSVETLAGNLVSLVELEVTENSILRDLNLREFRQKYGTVLVCIIERDDMSFIPSGIDTLRAGDKIFVAGLPKDMTAFQHLIGQKEKAIRSTLIVGGGKIAHYLLQLLEHTKMDIKVIERDLSRCEQLSVAFPFACIIHADGTDTEVLDEQGIEQYDSFISLTGVDEENLITSMYADKKGVRKIMTKMSRTNILKVIDDKRLKKIVTPKHLVADVIVRFVRARANAEGSNVDALYRVANQQAEVVQFKVKENCHLLNTPLVDLHLKAGLLIAYIIRNGKVIFPNGQDVILAQDKVIVITTHKDFSDIEDILEK